MNSKEKELHGYINATEKFSGFDSYDSAEGDMSYFDDAMEFDDNGMSYASGHGQQAVGVSDPYVLQYENTTSNDATAYIFGFNDYSGSANYGNPAAVVIANLQGGTYGRLFSQSNNKPFKIGKWRFQSSTPAQLQQTLTLSHFDGNGKTSSSPLNLSIAKDSYQQLSDQVDIVKVLSVDANTTVSFTLKANATLTISMFPITIISAKAQLNGRQAINSARAPRLSGKNVSPVIIQTSQNVQGVAKG